MSSFHTIRGLRERRRAEGPRLVGRGQVQRDSVRPLAASRPPSGDPGSLGGTLEVATTAARRCSDMAMRRDACRLCQVVTVRTTSMEEDI